MDTGTIIACFSVLVMVPLVLVGIHELRMQYGKHLVAITLMQDYPDSIQIRIRNDDQFRVIIDKIFIYCQGREFKLRYQITEDSHLKKQEIRIGGKNEVDLLISKDDLKEMNKEILEYVNKRNNRLIDKIFKFFGFKKTEINFFSFKLLIKTSGQIFVSKWIATETLIFPYPELRKNYYEGDENEENFKDVFLRIGETYLFKRRRINPSDEKGTVMNVAMLALAFLTIPYFLADQIFSIVALLLMVAVIEIITVHRASSGRLSVQYHVMLHFFVIFILFSLIIEKMFTKAVLEGILILGFIFAFIYCMAILLIIYWISGKSQNLYIDPRRPKWE